MITELTAVGVNPLREEVVCSEVDGPLQQEIVSMNSFSEGMLRSLRTTPDSAALTKSVTLV